MPSLLGVHWERRTCLPETDVTSHPAHIALKCSGTASVPPSIHREGNRHAHHTRICTSDKHAHGTSRVSRRDGLSLVVMTLRVRNVRWWIALGLAALVAEGVVSMLFFWPRNDIMFSEGLAVHSAEYLRQVAQEFETWHWLSRMLFNTIAAVSAFVGFLGLHKRRVLRSAVLA